MWIIIIIAIVVLILYFTSRNTSSDKSVPVRNSTNPRQALRDAIQKTTYQMIIHSIKKSGAPPDSVEATISAESAVIAIKQVLIKDITKLSRTYNLPEAVVKEIIDSEIASIYNETFTYR